MLPNTFEISVPEVRAPVTSRPHRINDQGYGRGGTPGFTGLFEPLARVTLYLKDENGLGSCFGAV